MNNNQCAIFISSCDSFTDAWDPFFKLFFKYWPDCPFPLYLIANKVAYPDKRVITIQTKEDRQWASNIKYAINKYKYPYILYLQEDYFLKSPVNTASILNLIRIVKKENAAYLRLYPSPQPDAQYKNYKELGEIDRQSSYRTSLQAAIWDTALLDRLAINGETAWDMELKGTERSRNLKELFLCTKKPAIDYYLTGIVKGRWEYGAVKFLKKEGFNIDYSIRGVEPKKTYLKRRLRSLFLIGRLFSLVFRVTEKYKRYKTTL